MSEVFYIDDSNGEVYADKYDFNRLMTKDEVDAFLDKTPSEEEVRNEEIAQLNASITPVRLAEAVLTKEGRTWLENVTEKIKKLEKKK